MHSWSSRLSTNPKIGSSVLLIVIGVCEWEALLRASSTAKVEKCFISGNCLYEQLLTQLSSELATKCYLFQTNNLIQLSFFIVVATCAMKS